MSHPKPRQYLGLALLVAILAGGSWWFQKNQWTTVTLTDPPVKFELPKILNQLPVTKDETENELDTIELLMEAALIDKESGPIDIQLRRETKLRLVKNLARAELREILLRNLERAYPTQFPDFKEVSRQLLERGDRDAADIVFTYTGPSSDQITQRLFLWIWDDDTALYLTAQTPTADFAKLNKTYFNRLFASLEPTS